MSNKRKASEREGRPKRSRKPTNYDSNHLHWIEENQLHKALMKSLKEKTLSDVDESESNASPMKVEPAKNENGIKRKTRQSARHSKTNSDNESQVNITCTHHAAMMQPSVVISANSCAGVTSSQDEEDGETQMKQSNSETQIMKTRAQRKFASNAVLPYDCTSTNKQDSQCNQCTSQALSSDLVTSNNAKLVKTDTFLDYLCFRNTSLEDKLFPNGLETL